MTPQRIRVEGLANLKQRRETEQILLERITGVGGDAGGGGKHLGNERNILVDNLLKRYNTTPALQAVLGDSDLSLGANKSQRSID